MGPLGRRVFDVDSGTRALALDVLRPLRRFPREFGRVIDRVRASARIPARPVPIRLAAIKALGHLRDDGALDLLVRMLDVDEERLREAAHQSLVLITRQDFGRSRDAWAGWVKEHRGEHRIEWLIEALMHEDAKLRRLAGDELKHLTQAYYGYQHSLPKRDREVAQRKYRQWWETEGRTIFR
ncbi:MAG: HEAT repeat domain-containing protein [Sandaracinaceae bacterium]|nr:HEAT repeat domain-containing protein [Sandaracinaceae bacterium]